VLGAGSAVFGIAVLAASDRELLLWSVALAILTVAVYVPLRLRRQQVLLAISRAGPG
jgi:hypothetical protein